MAASFHELQAQGKIIL